MQSALSRFSVARFASQPFAGYSMVSQSVTRAVTQPMDRRRRGCLVSESGLRSFLAFFLVLTSQAKSTPDTGELDGCHFSRDRWTPSQPDRVSSFNDQGSSLPSADHSFAHFSVRFLPVIVYGTILSFPEGVFIQGVKFDFRKRNSHENDTSRFLQETSHLHCKFCIHRMIRI